MGDDHGAHHLVSIAADYGGLEENPAASAANHVQLELVSAPERIFTRPRGGFFNGDAK